MSFHSQSCPGNHDHLMSFVEFFLLPRPRVPRSQANSTGTGLSYHMDISIYPPKPRGLAGLPHEILQQIAVHIADKQGLCAFALANEACHFATTPLLFRNIQLTIVNPEKLRLDVDALLNTLSRTTSQCHVRSLRLEGALRLRLDWLSGEDRSGQRWHVSTGLNEILPCEDPVYSDPLHRYHPGPVITKDSKNNKAWQPVASLINRLASLEALVYDCASQFPPILQDAIHQHPHCKLNHRSFRFQSDLPRTLHPHELALATSPRLHSLKVKCCRRDSSGRDDFTQEAIMDLVGLAPNLKEVEVINLGPGRSWNYNRPRGRWQGLPGIDAGSPAIGSLISLSFRGSHWAREPRLIQAWARHTDFSCLQRLVLGGSYMTEQGICEVVMDWVVQNCSFPHVKSLRVSLERRDIRVARPDWANTAVAFFRLFGPLQELSVYGSLEPIVLDVILSQHGPTLQKLCLYPWEEEFISPDGVPPTQRAMPMILGEAQVLQIQDQCPKLRELMICVKRTKSDQHEAAIYRIFGRMERLQSLFLVLDCSNWRVIRDSTYPHDDNFDDFDQELCKYGFKKGYIRESYLNSAVDEALARAIWNIINQNKIGAQLQALRLWTTGGGVFGDSTSASNHLFSIYRNLSRSWLVERVGDRADVRELGRRAREKRDQDTVPEDSEAMQIFRKTWPRIEGSGHKDWREDWQSLPLQI
ncbi:hypothetical protein BD289DRAFT_444594 [Coniella lustricola]|uniref:Uncharacterized protein n=1 Tax=Coniella lustricola TaxID=2025994 RepID=A0A2T2ZVQ1_9PEZI|nr:hypothetical protein BD289DRAFT_444594 [Coniella lustricola]